MPCAPLTPDFRRRGGTSGLEGRRRSSQHAWVVDVSVCLSVNLGAARDHLPVLSLAGLIAISGLAPTTPFLVVMGQWGRAGGAICEDHLDNMR